MSEKLSTPHDSLACRTTSAGTLTGPLQHLDSFLFQTFCCRSAAVFGIIVLLMSQFQPSFSCRTDGLTSDSRILWYPEEFKVDCKILCLQNKPKSSALHHRNEVFVLICCVCFSPNVLLCITTKHLHFGLVCPKDIVPKVLLFVQI